MMTLANNNSDIEESYVHRQEAAEDESSVGVLVVDDDRAIRETLRFMLEDADYAVSDAPDGMAALDILRASRRPLVVLLDLMMPRLDGAGVLRAVGADKRLATAHAYIVVTANLQAFTPALTSLLSCVDAEILRKPFDIDVLLDQVDRAARRLSTNERDSGGPGSSLSGHPLYH